MKFSDAQSRTMCYTYAGSRGLVCAGGRFRGTSLHSLLRVAVVVVVVVVFVTAAAARSLYVNTLQKLSSVRAS